MGDGYTSSTATWGWVRVVMPSAADLIFVALLGALLLTPLSVRLLGDAGIGWHIRTGQQILARHAIPRVDSFSVTMQGEPWFAWEWLYDVAVGWLESVAGLNGVVWFTGVVIAAVFAWLFRLLVARGTNFVVALGLTLLALSASMIHFLARPHVVSWLLALGWFWILDLYERNGEQWRSAQNRNSGRKWITNRLWILPVLMLVWVNVHGGFLIGFVLLGIFWLSAVWEWWTTTEGRIEEVLQKISAAGRVRNLIWVGLVSAVATVVNPYGWKLHAHIYSYLTNRFLMDHIEEFQSPNFHGIAQKCFAVLILITFVVLAGKIPTLTAKSAARMGHPRSIRVSGVLTILFAVHAGLYAARNVPVSAILLAMVVGPVIGEVRSGQGFSQRMAAVETGLHGHAWPVLAVVVAFCIAVNGGRVGSNQMMDAHFNAKRMPVDAVNFLERQNLPGPVLSPDYWGGYLIYRMNGSPGSAARVVVDDRHDLYGEKFLKEYLKMWHVEEGWEEFLYEHPAGHLVLPRNAALTNALLENPLWKVIYKDDVAVVFENRSANR
jgi:hypothetical protein